MAYSNGSSRKKEDQHGFSSAVIEPLLSKPKQINSAVAAKQSFEPEDREVPRPFMAATEL